MVVIILGYEHAFSNGGKVVNESADAIALTREGVIERNTYIFSNKEAVLLGELKQSRREEENEWQFRKAGGRYRCLRLHCFMARQVASCSWLHCQGLCSRPESVISLNFVEFLFDDRLVSQNFFN